VALLAYEVYSAAIPDDEDAVEEKSVQARPAPGGNAGAHVRARSGQLRQGKSASRNGTAIASKTAKGAVGGKGKKSQRKAQKNGAVKQGKGKQQASKVKKSKIKQNTNKDGAASTANKEVLSNKRNKNQFKKAPANKLDRQLSKTDMAASHDPLDEEESVDYGPPQAPPSSGNRLLKKPDFAPRQKSVDSAKPMMEMAEPSNTGRMMRPMPLPMEIAPDVMPPEGDREAMPEGGTVKLAVMPYGPMYGGDTYSERKPAIMPYPISLNPEKQTYPDSVSIDAQDAMMPPPVMQGPGEFMPIRSLPMPISPEKNIGSIQVEPMPAAMPSNMQGPGEFMPIRPLPLLINPDKSVSSGVASIQVEPMPDSIKNPDMQPPGEFMPIRPLPMLINPDKAISAGVASIQGEPMPTGQEAVKASP